ncbi:MAG: hypothetical protein IT381_04880 [Deltaproteobacteria bacterium]|nr:hypothetical protein [Deltaproteobacteria bacterium]
METAVTLLARAEKMAPSDPSANKCWRLVVRAIDAGWMQKRHFAAIAAALKKGNGYGVEELIFEPSGSEVEVSFLGERARCPSTPLIKALEQLAA